MAAHNYVNLLGMVRRAPEIKQGKYGMIAMCPVTIIRGERDHNSRMVDNQTKYSTPVIVTENQTLVDEIATWNENDIVHITGFIATKEVEKAEPCEHCGAMNARREACVEHGAKTGGNLIYIFPIFAEKVKAFSDQGLAHKHIIDRAEISNRVFVMGNLTKEPVMGTLEGSNKVYTRFQVAINRKYCPEGMEQVLERTDYPWVYSYGEDAKKNFQVLHTGSLVYIDGAIQTRKYKETYTCQTCGKTYEVKGKAMEILAYDTEYLYNCDFKKLEQFESEE